MAIRTEAIDGWIEYVPDFAGNRESDDPCVMEIHPMSHAEARAHSRAFRPALTALQGGRKADIESYERKAADVIAARVRNIRGLVWYGVPITSGRALADSGPPALCADVMEAIQDISKLSDDLKNGYGWVLDCSKAGTQPSTGDVPDAVDPQTSGD